MLRRFATDPLVPFLLVAALCYALFDRGESEVVAVSADVRAALAEDHLALTGRAPTAAEMETLVERWISDEILFREALARGLHEGDVRTRHRLIDKMRFLLVDEPAPPAPDDLLAHYLEHIDTYTTEWRLTFDHRYWPSMADMPDDALERLNAGEDVAGADYWLGDVFDDYHVSMLRSILGGVAVRRMLEGPDDEWLGPLMSPRGVHLVRITDRRPPEPIPFEAARARVADDWVAAERARRLALAVDALGADYEIERGD